MSDTNTNTNTNNPYSILASQIKELSGPLSKLRENYANFQMSYEQGNIEEINSQMQKINTVIENSKNKEESN